MSSLLLQELCQLSVKNLGFHAKFSYIGDKSVCFNEKQPSVRVQPK